MLKVIRGYLPKNKALSRLGRKARLELILKGEVSERTLDEMRFAKSCWRCKWYTLDKRVLGQTTYSCTKSGVKAKRNVDILFRLGREKQEPCGIRIIPYCGGFEEKD